MARTSEKDVALLNAGYRYALSLSASECDAEDLVHDAWVRLMRHQHHSPDKPLLYRTIRNLYIDRYRRRRKFPEVEYQEFDQATVGHAEDQSFDLIKADEMNDVLARLRDQERETLYLSVVEGYTVDEIGSLTDRARGTVLSQIHRTKAKLRKYLEKRDADPGDGTLIKPSQMTGDSSGQVISLNRGKNRS